MHHTLTCLVILVFLHIQWLELQDKKVHELRKKLYHKKLSLHDLPEVLQAPPFLVTFAGQFLVFISQTSWLLYFGSMFM